MVVDPTVQPLRWSSRSARCPGVLPRRMRPSICTFRTHAKIRTEVRWLALDSEVSGGKTLFSRERCSKSAVAYLPWMRRAHAADACAHGAQGAGKSAFKLAYMCIVYSEF
jgi:hypothetical protein